MDILQISQIANLLRPCTGEISSGKGILCLSANYLNKLNKAIELSISDDTNASFHIVQTSNAKTNLIRDVQFLLDLIQKTINLKLNPDVTDDFHVVDITRFKNIKTLEIHKLDINVVKGIQKVRSQLQELTCCHCMNHLNDVLGKCGGDNSQRFSWSELKKANFSRNNITELDDSLECMISLHTLDLSHNTLDKVQFLNQLPNLKHLNLSYNKLSCAPSFKGQICNRLQILVIHNNFIEDLIGLTSLTNIVQLDLSKNCLLDTKVLASISHLISLQCLNLQGNPFSFDPHYRIKTCNYLNKNATTLKFQFDGLPLSKIESSLTGTFSPATQLSSSLLLDSPTGSVQERPRRIRTVTIEEDNAIKDIVPILTPSASSQHLEIKRQVEQLREEYGESWLYRDSGLLVQDVLGFEKTSVLSSTPYESAIDSLYMSESNNDKTELVGESKEEFTTANEDSTIFNGAAQAADEASDASDGEEMFSGGEESIYLATNKEDDTQVFVVFTERHILEKDVTTSKEKARWDVNTIKTCEKSEEQQNVITLEFDTVRRDRKQRTYELDQVEVDAFYTAIREKFSEQTPSEKKTIYQCMKCLESFSRKTENGIMDEPLVTCPKCQSNLVVESM